MDEIEVRTFDLLGLVETNVSSNFQSIANKGITTSVMNGPLNGSLILDDIDRETSTFGERPELIVDRLDLNGVQWNESGLSCALVSHVL